MKHRKIKKTPFVCCIIHLLISSTYKMYWNPIKSTCSCLGLLEHPFHIHLPTSFPPAPSFIYVSIFVYPLDSCMYLSSGHLLEDSQSTINPLLEKTEKTSPSLHKYDFSMLCDKSVWYQTITITFWCTTNITVNILYWFGVFSFYFDKQLKVTHAILSMSLLYV